MQQVELVEQQAAPVPDEPEAEPVEVVVEKPNFWKYKGDGYLQFMQNYVSGNWYKGGESNYAAVGSLTLEANYDNKSEVEVGQQAGDEAGLPDLAHRLRP